MKRLALHPTMGTMAKKLMGAPLRLWHDQLLIKRPGRSGPTAFHYDEAYHPHAGASHLISVWMALCDVPVERGCMTFIPGSHRRTDLPPQPQNLKDPCSLLDVCPALQWEPTVTVPIRTGDCTFHHGRCCHMAAPNTTNEARVAHVAILMRADTRFDGREHPITRSLPLKAGDPLEHEMFPLV